MAVKFAILKEEERAHRDALNPVVAKKRQSETAIVEAMCELDTTGLVVNGIAVMLKKRRMSAPDGYEVRARLEDMGFDDDMMNKIIRVFKDSERYIYDVHVSE